MKGTNLVLALHPAGGSARSFVPLRRTAPTGWTVATYELAGQGKRRTEPRCKALTQAADEIAALVAGSRPRVLFGVSLGAAAALASLSRLPADSPMPERVVLASVAPPTRQGVATELGWINLDDQALAERLLGAGITTEQVLAGPWAAESLADLRANLRLVQEYQVTVPVTDRDLEVWLGRDDPLARPDVVTDWFFASRGKVQVKLLEGGHLWPLQQDRQAEVWAMLTGNASA